MWVKLTTLGGNAGAADSGMVLPVEEHSQMIQDYIGAVEGEELEHASAR